MGDISRAKGQDLHLRVDGAHLGDQIDAALTWQHQVNQDLIWLCCLHLVEG
jgi:hypothetical protein